MTDVPRFSDAEKLAALKREVAMRQNVYAKRVAEGKMSMVEAKREIDVMRAIASDYEGRTLL